MTTAYQKHVKTVTQTVTVKSDYHWRRTLVWMSQSGWH